MLCSFLISVKPWHRQTGKFFKRRCLDYGLSKPEWFNINTVILAIEEMLSSDNPRISQTDLFTGIFITGANGVNITTSAGKKRKIVKVSLIPYLTSMEENSFQMKKI
jgi:hypothetical protein